MAFIRNILYGQITGAGSLSTHLDVNIGADASSISFAALSTYAEAVYAAWKAQMFQTGDQLTSLSSNAVTWRGVNSYLYPDYGGGDAVALGVSSGAAVSGTGSPTCPPQVALVASTLTDTPGDSGRGRMYWPALGPAVSTGNQVTASVASNLASQTADWISAVRLIVPGSAATHIPVVVSRRQATGTPITRVRVDTALDTVRARRDKVVPIARAISPIVVG